MDLDGLLDAFASGNISREELKRRLRATPVEAVEAPESYDFARLDLQREIRTGMAEVVFCRGKTPEQVSKIFERLAAQSGRVLGTRASEEQHLAVAASMPVAYHPVSRLLVHGDPLRAELGKVVVISAGTSDLPVAEEAAQTAEFYGSKVLRRYDCGVAGIHRLESVSPDLGDASVVVAVAGMDGALAAVVAGMCEPPVIGVPTSVGYGASFSGIGPLLTMLNSCAPGVSVVNIDNGFGAGHLAHVINARLARARNET